ncbi:MAG: alpha/beta fold hydrolase [Erysipelotrichaceae bacterium]|nr:alpha/beta fold hydrolase [Erysipelotrichaceae bacterium]
MSRLLRLIPLTAAAGLSYVAWQCLEKAVHPQHFTEEEVRASEAEKGFSHAQELYDHIWSREPFELELDEVTISGEIIRNPVESRKAVIIAHGHTVNRIASLKYAELFYKAGFHVVIYDQRSFGRSSGKNCTLDQSESQDLAKLIDYAGEVFGENCRIGIHGESMGAATALLSLRYRVPDFIIADCPFSDTEALYREWINANTVFPASLILPIMKPMAMLEYQYDIKDTSPIEAVRNSEVPICFFHGTSDKLIDCHHSRDLAAACRNPLSRVHFIEGAEHARSITVDPKGYEEKVLSFLSDCGL